MKHIITTTPRKSVSFRNSTVYYDAVIDGIPVKVSAQCRKTGRPGSNSAWQVAWYLRFDNPEVNKHPDYQEIRAELCKQMGIPIRIDKRNVKRTSI